MITINELQIENLKNVKAVKLEPSASGLTVIGGLNGQGKTSILNAIAWALGGEKFRPGNPARGGALTLPNLHGIPIT
nr:MAG TPA: STRUCTURAL MAINTENANCE OF CHROMOSOMES PROTEIN [Caudoviricetes sp.]